MRLQHYTLERAFLISVAAAALTAVSGETTGGNPRDSNSEIDDSFERFHLPKFFRRIAAKSILLT
jgi:hypothetical protein